MSPILSRSRFAIAAAVLASMTSHIAAQNALSIDYPLNECVGDCDTDEDCQNGLWCFNRNNGTFPEIPGCSGNAFDLDTPTDSIDYCVQPRPDILRLVGNNGDPADAYPLQVCQGDCDTDAECAGSLQCFNRDDETPVPGCLSKGISGEDYCYSPEVVDSGCVEGLFRPGYNPMGWDNDDTYGADVQLLREYMHGFIANDILLIGKFMRMGFHDCVGGKCDGCIDLDDGDNKGLEIPMNMVAGCKAAFQNKFSRADCWAMATLAASEAAAANDVTKTVNVTYPMTYIGRCDCEGAEINGNGGPLRHMPSADLTTQQLVDFFQTDFGQNYGSTFTPEQYATVILGAHGPATANRFNSGFGNIDPFNHTFRKDGWTGGNTGTPAPTDMVLSNGYYVSLVNPCWHQQFLDNINTKVIVDGVNLTMAAFNVPDRWQWYIDPDQENVIMTNSDIALHSNFENFIFEDAFGVPGVVTCLFTTECGEFEEGALARFSAAANASDVGATCPSATATMSWVNAYLGDNDGFHSDFEAAIDIMVNNGYVFSV